MAAAAAPKYTHTLVVDAMKLPDLAAVGNARRRQPSLSAPPLLLNQQTADAQHISVNASV